jgi:hypothetical protein
VSESTFRKTDVLNLRLDPSLAAEIQRVADWRETTAGEIARELLRHGIAVERQLQAQELQRGYDYSNIERDRDTGYLKIDAAWITYTMRELAEIYELQDEVPRS